jgi:hypothetical protein
LTPKQVADMVHKHEEAVTLALRLGDLQGKQPKAKGRWLVKEEDVEAWVDRGFKAAA